MGKTFLINFNIYFTKCKQAEQLKTKIRALWSKKAKNASWNLDDKNLICNWKELYSLKS